MDTPQLLALGAVVAAWAVLAYTIRRWGPGRAWRRVRCPEKNVRAHVLVEQREGDFGRLHATDVAACSLVEGALTCDKSCLARL